MNVTIRTSLLHPLAPPTPRNHTLYRGYAGGGADDGGLFAYGAGAAVATGAPDELYAGLATGTLWPEDWYGDATGAADALAARGGGGCDKAEGQGRV